MKQTILIILLALILTACGAGNTGTPVDQPTTGAANAYATALAAPVVNNTVVTSVRPSIGETATTVSDGKPTELAPTPIGSSTLVSTATTTRTATARPRPRSSATATPTTVPLSFIGMGVYVVKCGFVPTEDKPGQVVIQISIEVTGGNGVYQYFDNDGKLWPTKFIDLLGEKGTASIGKITVTSKDGQSIHMEYDISPNGLKCS